MDFGYLIVIIELIGSIVRIPFIDCLVISIGAPYAV